MDIVILGLSYANVQTGMVTYSYAGFFKNDSILKITIIMVFSSKFSHEFQFVILIFCCITNMCTIGAVKLSLVKLCVCVHACSRN